MDPIIPKAKPDANKALSLGIFFAAQTTIDKIKQISTISLNTTKAKVSMTSPDYFTTNSHSL